MVQNMRLRYRLKNREIKEIVKKATATLGDIKFTFLIKDIEVVKINPQNEVLLIDGVPRFINVSGEVYPTLLNREILERLPKITVDMGAVPHICGGADLMAPGIAKAGEFQAESIAVIVDERFSQPIALVKTLYNSLEMPEKGKVAINVHYVDDKFWKAFKKIRSVIS